MAYETMQDLGVNNLEIAPANFFFKSKDFFNPTVEEVKLRFNELYMHKIKLVSMQALLFKSNGLKLFGCKEERYNFEIYMSKILKFAKEFNIQNLVFGSPDQRFIPNNLDRNEAVDIAKTIFFRLGEQAKELGVILTIEPVPKVYKTNFLNTFFEVKDFVLDISSAGLKCTLDIGALLINKEYEKLFSYPKDLKGIINHVHLSEPFLFHAPKSIEFTKQVLNFLYHFKYSKAISIEMKPPTKGILGVRHSLEKVIKANKILMDKINE